MFVIVKGCCATRRGRYRSKRNLVEDRSPIVAPFLTKILIG